MGLELHEIRRANGRAAIANAGGTNAVAQTMGYANPSYMSQLFGPNPDRKPTEKIMRRLEVALGLDSMSLDNPDSDAVRNADKWVPIRTSKQRRSLLLQEAAVQAAAATRHMTAEMVRSTIDMVSRIIETERISVTPAKALSLASLAITDAMEHGGQPREQHIQTLVRLAGS